MTKTDDGGPAFPTSAPVPGRGQIAVASFKCSPGMSLRDWFAGQALMGMCANPKGCIVEPPEEPNWKDSPASRGGGGSPGDFLWDLYGEEAARLSFAVADQMLAERTKEA